MGTWRQRKASPLIALFLYPLHLISSLSRPSSFSCAMSRSLGNSASAHERANKKHKKPNSIAARARHGSDLVPRHATPWCHARGCGRLFTFISFWLVPETHPHPVKVEEISRKLTQGCKSICSFNGATDEARPERGDDSSNNQRIPVSVKHHSPIS